METAGRADGQSDESDEAGGRTDARSSFRCDMTDPISLTSLRVSVSRADEVIRDDTAASEYRVYMLGFVPGFAFLGLLDPSLELPRRSSPRLRVPAGSVAIAGRQTAVYPLDTPGGWHLLGRTDLALFDAHGRSAGPARSGRPGALRGDTMIEIVKAPPFATVQDRGRHRLRSQGVPTSGAMDVEALVFANLLAGNAPGRRGDRMGAGRRDDPAHRHAELSSCSVRRSR